MTSATRDPGKEMFLSTLRPLVEAYFAFSAADQAHVRRLGLTPSQFDVISTLGETGGMTCKTLSEKTLVTKGTLTGVLDRLEKKGLTERIRSTEDRRVTVIRLTSRGDKTFREVFPAHIRYLKPYFERALTVNEMKSLRSLLLRLKASFEQEDL